MKSFLFAGAFLFTASLAQAQVATINQWQSKSSEYATISAAILSAQMDPQLKMLVFSLPEGTIVSSLKSRAHSVSQAHFRRFAHNLTEAPLPPVASPLAVAEGVSSLQYNSCFNSMNEAALCFPAEYKETLHKTAEAYLQASLVLRQFYSKAVMALGNEQERQELRNKQIEAQNAYDEIAQRAETLKSQETQGVGISLAVSGILAVLMLILYIANPAVAFTAETIIAGLAGAAFVSTTVFGLRYVTIKENTAEPIRIARESRDTQNYLIKVIAQAVAERQEPPSSQFKP